MRRLLVLLAVGATALTACTAVPGASAPQVVRPVEINPQTALNPPPAGASASTIVQYFLDASASDRTTNHNDARQALTADYRQRWSDATIRIVSDAPVPLPRNGKITISTRLVGTVDPSGQYTPSLRGTGDGPGGTPQTLVFGIQQVDGQNRISSISPNNLVLTSDEFSRLPQRALYYFDTSGRLVPDPRYTDLVDSQDLASWLVSQLAANSKSLTSSLPTLADPSRIRVTVPPGSAADTPVRIDLPGSSKFGATIRDRIAAQLAATLAQVRGVSQLELTDGGRPVSIPQVGGPVFTAVDVLSRYTVASPARGGLYYVRGGGVVDDTGTKLPGRVGNGVYDLTSVAMQERGLSGSYRIAGVRGSGKNETLDIGTQNQLTATSVHGELSRPSWAPASPEVWIGVGSVLKRVSTAGVVSDVQVDVAAGKASGVVSAVRISPDGGRVALVLTAGDGTAQAYVGAIERQPNQAVRVIDLLAITPQGVKVTDIAWNDQLKLFATGTNVATGAYGVFEVQCDGSLWTRRGTVGLPGPPQSVTVAANSVAAVSVGQTVWRQDAGSEFAGTWEGPAGNDTPGQNPVYVE